MTMLAVSIRQPWAWAVIHAGKDVENRTEAAAKRMRRGIGQRILIHASKAMFVEDYDDIVALMRSHNLGEPPDMDDLDEGAGCVIGSAIMTGIIDPAVGYKSPWYTGRSGLILTDPSPCTPIPLRGQLGLYNSGIKPARLTSE